MLKHCKSIDDEEEEDDDDDIGERKMLSVTRVWEITSFMRRRDIQDRKEFMESSIVNQKTSTIMEEKERAKNLTTSQ